jgi:uncharacterized membrane protein YjjP (DUF1212 family)
MPNQKKHALRYLLLRFLSTAKELTSTNLYKEVTKTLIVDETDKGFIVRWRRDDREFQKNYGKDEFKFYTCGDNIEQSAIDPIDRQHNTKLAREFVREALGISQIKEETNREPNFPRMFLILSGYATCAALLWLVGGKNMIMASGLIFVMFAAEFWYQKGKVAVPPLIAVFIFIGFPFTAIVTASIYSLLQFLDPNKSLRRFRTFFSLAIVGYCLLDVIWNKVDPFYDPWLALIVTISIVVFLVHLTSGSHFRSFPLAFPFLCVGMYLDGYVSPAMMGLACAIIAASFSHIGFRLFPVQKERSLATNG